MNVRLRPLAPPDVEALYEWSQDETFCRAAGWTLGLDREAMNRFWPPLLATRAEDFVRLGIEQQGQLVGYADLAGIDRAAGAAEFGIAIGPSHRWGQVSAIQQVD